VRISVADNGAGIAAENLTRFSRTGFTTRRDGMASACTAARWPRCSWAAACSRTAMAPPWRDVHARPADRAAGSAGVNDTSEARRVLVIDDNPAIHQDFRKIFGAGQAEERTPADLALFGEAEPAPAAPFLLDSAFQGEQGLELCARRAHATTPMPWRSSTCACRPAGMASRPLRASGATTRIYKW